MKTRLLLSTLVGLLYVPFISYGQFPYNESFKAAAAPRVVISGAATLTAAAGIDPAGQGYLRLTENTTYSVGCVYGQQVFPSAYGLDVSFEFFPWKAGATGTNQADGITFFLFDASVNSFRPGGTGGALGYTQYYTTPGMAKGYIGISLDEFGNFSSASDGNKNGGPGQQRSSVAIRGPGNGKTPTDYVYQTGVMTTDALYNAGFNGFTQRYPDPLNAGYRRLRVILYPGSSLGAAGYTITVIMYKGGATVTPVTLINNFDYPFIAPAALQFGLSGSTGSITNYHEIRNMSIGVANTGALVPPTALNDSGVIACQGQQALIDITANDSSGNSGGSMNKSTVDLDPATAGRQTLFTDAGKGTYSVDAGGIVSFVPLNGFAGVSTISYKADDTYGATSAGASITVTVSGTTGPVLAIANPAGACSPSFIDITNPALKTATTPGAVYDYFGTLTNANKNINSISAAATGITAAGTYYIRAELNGCATIKPVVVQISQPSSTANAGPDLAFCSSAGAQTTTLAGSNPDVGVGTWTQVSGPAAAAINYPDAATCPVSNMANGIYVFRWSVISGACTASTDDIQIIVGIPASAGAAQSIANATSATLAGNTPSPAAGVWSQVSGPAVTITAPSNPATTITGLVPGNTYGLSWKITNGTCISNSTVTITDVLNTMANAGADQVAGDFSPFALAGNIPGTANTGGWTLISAPSGSTATITSPASPSTNVTSVNKMGDYVFRWTITNGSFSNYDEMTIRVTTVLPVTLLSFTGKPEKDYVTLLWQTAAEENNHHFEVERSADGIRFSGISVIAGAGVSSVLHNYSCYDGAVAGLKEWYYRLKQVDRDGRSSYSGTIKISRTGGAGFNAWPNPFTDKIYIETWFDAPGAIQLNLYDGTGKVIRSVRQQAAKGDNHFFIEKLQRLLKGPFYAEVLKDGIRYKQLLIKL